MEPEAPTVEKLNLDILELVQKYRARCLWFAPADYQPQDHAERLQALEYIQKHGDREAFIRARELQKWLLQTSSET